MGIFADHAPEYAAHGLRVFPTGGEDGKIPLMRGWPKVRVNTVAKLVQKFPDANIAVIDGDRITRVDIDDFMLTRDAIDRFGDTPVKIRTPSEGIHLWYAANGEHRLIGLDGQKIDILGKGGFGLVPPSVRPGSYAYEFIEGGLGDIGRLPMIRSGALPRHCYRDHRPDDHHVKKPSASATAAGKVVIGHRTIALFAELRRIAHNCETIHELDFRASGFNEAMLDPPLTEAKVNLQVRGVWKLKVEGRCIPPGSTVAAIGPEVERLYRDPLALAVWVHIRRHHGPTHEFAVSTTGLAKVFGCHRTSIAKARDFLEQSGFIVQTHTGRGPKDPHRFRLSP